MATLPRRRWDGIAIGVALVLSFAVLIGVGMVNPAASSAPPGRTAAQAQGSRAPADWLRKLKPGEKPPQFVLFSFDGAGSHEHWKRILPIAQRTGARFTAFLSGIYLLPDSRRTEYLGPGHEPGHASISFGGSDADVRTRVRDLNTATAHGHEIATHYNGHYCSGNEPSVANWTAAQWRSELDQFFAIIREANTRGLRIDPKSIQGSRTPCQEGDPDVFLPLLFQHGMSYDSSMSSEGVAWPEQVGGVWEFWVPVVRVPALSGKKVTMMDYNLWYSLNGAVEDPSRDTEFMGVTVDTYRAAYQAAFTTNRAPLTIGNHFNDWSGGAFSKATEKFMAEVCGKAQTVCATYTEVIKWMELQDPAVLDALRALPHAQVS
jgi:hypothetical protein